MGCVPICPDIIGESSSIPQVIFPPSAGLVEHHQTPSLALRQPLEDEAVTILRAFIFITFSARFQSGL